MNSGELFDRESLPRVRGKSLESLAYSRQRRDQLLEMFDGEVPSSIMRKRVRTDNADPALGSYTETQGQYVADDASKLEREAFSISNAGVASGALSLFPQNVGRAILLLYSEPGDVVVDPFAGHNSRMDLCAKEGRHYVGYDISDRFMAYNKERAKYLRSVLPDIEIVLHHQDSRSLSKTRDGFGDFTITSPPYYDIEDYGDEAAQLGKCPSYESFLDDLTMVMRENFRVLKPGAFAAWFVNDFRRDKKFFPYHIDTVERMRSAGFVFHDICIVDLGSSFREAFVNQIVETRILPKRHEYGLIFRKPS